MRLEGAFDVAAPASRLWDLFWDLEALGACLPGCEGLQRVDDKTFTGVLKARVGPVQARFQCKVTITEMEAPARLVLRAEGEDNRTASRMRANAELTLTSVDKSHTRAGYRAEVTIVGRLGQFGDGIIRETASVLMEQFAGNVRSRLEAGGGGPPPRAGELNMFRILGQVLVRWLRGGLGRWWRRLRRARGTSPAQVREA